MKPTPNAPDIPERMQHLPRDTRGYPIPFVVMMDGKGTPHFVINDGDKSLRCAKEGLCHICGNALEHPMCFVGGPRSAFHGEGAFFDGPMHIECAHYALQVCPYLALPGYRGATVEKRVEHFHKKNEGKGPVAFVDSNVMPGRPSLFVLAVASNYRAIVKKLKPKGVGVYFVPKKPFVRTEFWRDGRMIDHAEGRTLSAAVMREGTPEIGEPRLVRPEKKSPEQRMAQAKGWRLDKDGAFRNPGDRMEDGSESSFYYDGNWEILCAEAGIG